MKLNTSDDFWDDDTKPEMLDDPGYRSGKPSFWSEVGTIAIILAAVAFAVFVSIVGARKASSERKLRTEEARQEGAAARKGGASSDANPYDNHRYRRAWLNGWVKGTED
ncbi:MAG TPA: hypothetical protein DCE55_29310 [Planctomycetaceae bacterium]|nr:hypothetical protein [Planctomycetaceae bacterium]|tara:strand:- start:11208 stop:11534 length:327 start_codon:yes stop_codon:yes gene_type:complete